MIKTTNVVFTLPYNKGSISLKGKKAVQNCPQLVLTDPHYRQANDCHVVVGPMAARLNNNDESRESVVCQCTLNAIH